MSELVSLKITIDQDANYLLLGSQIFCYIQQLDEFCKKRYQELQKNVDSFHYYWIDDDGDEIRITTDQDLNNLYRAKANGKARVYVVSKKATVVEPRTADEPTTESDDAPMQNGATSDDVSARPVHQYAICDVCDERIVGHRYKCLTCHDYDLCMSCEAKYRHKDHLMLRIPKPAMVDRSQSTVSRMLDKLRVYSVRIISNVEKDAAVPEAENSVPAGNEPAEANASKRANARSAHRSKHSEERRTHESTKPSRGSKSSGNNDRKHQGCAAGETSGERSSKEKKEKPCRVSTLSELTQQCRDMMLTYLNSTEGYDSARKPFWSNDDHAAVAKMAAAMATAAAANATALASKVMEADEEMENSNKTPETTQSDQDEVLYPMSRQNQQQQTATAVQQPFVSPLASVMPMPFLPFVNLPWPSQEKLMVASENVSKLLDPLGLSFEIRHKSSASPSTSPGSAKTHDGEDGTVPSTSATVAETASPIPTASTVEPSSVQQKKNQDNTTVPSVAETASLSGQQQQANTAVPGCAESTEINGTETKKPNSGDTAERTTLELDFVCEGKPAAEAENVDDEDDSQNTSSASLLTDDDQDLLEVVAQEELKASSSSKPKPPAKAEKSWTLIDLPQEQDETRMAYAPLDAIAKLIGHDLPTPDKEPLQPKSLSVSKEKKQADPADENQKVSKKASRKSSAAHEDEFESAGKALMNERLEKSPSMRSMDVKSLSNAAMMNPGPSASSSSAGSGGRSGKSSRKSSSAQQKDNTVYSHRPHVNHAIHTMMTMGFSNHNGWLTQLLESLNGDIPKALDLLLQHRH
uniref:ZZ-type domain-containing protein n=1 Tax=Anopheles minimus TaxID=112268 RepID=A0A182W8Y6_9DIPT